MAVKIRLRRMGAKNSLLPHRCRRLPVPQRRQIHRGDWHLRSQSRSLPL